MYQLILTIVQEILRYGSLYKHLLKNIYVYI